VGLSYNTSGLDTWGECPMFMMKVTSEVADMRELSMLCMDWVSGVPREERVTKLLFCTTPDKKTAFIPSDMWDKTIIKLSKADTVALSKVRPAYAGLARIVNDSPSITLKTLYAALNSASDGKVFTEQLDFTDDTFVYPVEVGEAPQ
jgi:hypothetical protein